MIVFPNCKINLGLDIINKREDGFHNLETIFFPIPLTDILEILPAPNANEQVRFSTTGLVIDGNSSNNLCIKAYQLLQEHYTELPAIQMHLHKIIPMGAGLGGGSADGAFALQLINDLFKLNISTQQLINFALALGSDCPFFIINKPCFGSGRGEILEPLLLDLSSYFFVLVNPKIHINTGWAFSKIQPSVPTKSIKTIITQPIETWKNELQNCFEKAAIEEHIEIGNIKEYLYQQGAVYAAMTGSGSTVFGIFNKQQKPNLNFEQYYFVHQTN